MQKRHKSLSNDLLKSPNLFCLGAPKCGTTSLYQMLSQHEMICVPIPKEPHFFCSDVNYSRGLDYYKRAYFSNFAGEEFVCDFTPSYLASPAAPKRIYDAVGENAKFIIIARNPVDRLYSHYLHNVRDALEFRPFEVAIAEDAMEFSQGITGDYVSPSSYGFHLQRYLEFFPRSNLLFLIFEEDLAKHPQICFDAVCGFLGIQKKQLSLPLKRAPSPEAKKSMLWLKYLINTRWPWREKIKGFVSPRLRQNIRQTVNYIGNRPSSESKRLDVDVRMKLLSKYFDSDIKIVEDIICRSLNCWRR